MGSWIKSGGGGSSRYNSFDSSSTKTTPRSSSADPSSNSAFKRLTSRRPADLSIVKAKPNSDLLLLHKKNKKKEEAPPILGSMVKKLMGGGSKPKKGDNSLLLIPPPANFIAEDLKKKKKKKDDSSSSWGGLHKKLFATTNKGRGGKTENSERKEALLTDVNSNTTSRTLAMVLRSERELLGLNKDLHSQTHHLNSMLLLQNTQVEKLKDLCLKQKEEIRSLKSAVLFPDTMNMEDLLEKQGSQLNQANQLIPTLQRQVTSLTGQLHCLAVDLAEVKADKYSARSCHHDASPKTPTYDQQDATYSLEDFGSDDQATTGSPDDMFLKDLNPCLTPYSKTKSYEVGEVVYESPEIKASSRSKLQLGVGRNINFGPPPYLNKMSKSCSDCCNCSNSGSSSFAQTGGGGCSSKSDETTNSLA